MIDCVSGVLNVCSPYTSRDEITTALRDTVQEVYDGSLPLRSVFLHTLRTYPLLHSLSHIRESLPSSQESARYSSLVEQNLETDPKPGKSHTIVYTEISRPANPSTRSLDRSRWIVERLIST